MTDRSPQPSRRRLLGGLTLLAVLPVAAACESMDPTLQQVPDTPPPPAPEVRLQAGDKLRITVFGEDKLSGEYEVDSGGVVSVPLAGSIRAAGLTKPELERSLTTKLAGGYLRNPKVTVEVLTARPFYILGEVEKPGEYPYRPGLNIMSAIAVAGGNTYRASKSKVYIQRGGQGGFQEVPLGPTVPVYPGDIVKVPERYF